MTNRIANWIGFTLICCFASTAWGQAEPVFPENCVGLCERTAYCQTEAGEPVGADEQDCAASCLPGASYASMPFWSYTCVSESCSTFFGCSGDAIGEYIEAIMSGGLGEAPAGYPENFPFFTGGLLMETPSTPVTTIAMAYERPLEELERILRNELNRIGWSIDSEEVGFEPTGNRLRLEVSRETTRLSISVYDFNGLSILQVMIF